MKRLIKLLTVIIIMTIAIPATAFAQSASESYSNGVALMKKGEYKKAIASFQASMAINKSEANRKKCNQQIAKCQRALKYAASTEPAPMVNESQLSLSKHRIPFPWNPMEDLSVNVVTEPLSNDWMAAVEGNADWIELSKSMDGKALIVKCKPTDSTVKRQAKVAVTYGGKKENIDVVQYGKEVNFSADPLELSFKLKGGKQLVNIQCNSDTAYEDGKNWRIKQTPEWLKAEVTKTTLVIEASKLEKNSPEYKTGRMGQIIIVSQDKECVLKVEQKKSIF